MFKQESMPIKYPRNAIEALHSILIPPETPSSSVIDLIITLPTSGMKARDLSSYLSFIDHVYGRLDPKGLISYAHRKEGHLEIANVRTKSIELVLSEILESSEKLGILYIVLKYLPEFVRNLTGAFKDFEEARFTRLRRRELRDRIRKDEELAGVSENHKNQLVELLDEFYIRESDTLPGAQRLSREHVRRVSLRIRTEASDDSQSLDNRSA